MPYPNLQALVDGATSVGWAAPREEAKAVMAELKRLHRVVAACERTREKQRNLDQALESLFGNHWQIYTYRDLDGGIVAIGTHRKVRGVYGAGGRTFTRAIVELAAKVADGQQRTR